MLIRKYAEIPAHFCIFGPRTQVKKHNIKHANVSRLEMLSLFSTWRLFFLCLLRLAAGLGDGLRDELLGEVDDLLEVGLQLQQLRVGRVGGQGGLNLL